MRTLRHLATPRVFCLALAGLLLAGALPADEGAGTELAATSQAQPADVSAAASAPPPPTFTADPALARSHEGLVPVVLPDGTIMLDLQGRFMVFAVAKELPDGTRTFEITRRVVPADEAQAASSDSAQDEPEPELVVATK